MQETEIWNQKNVLASLDKVVVYGCPPLATRICNLVSLKSFPATPLDVLEAVFAPVTAAADVSELSGTGLPSRSAFSRANFSARACLSASIWALTAALARASSILSSKTWVSETGEWNRSQVKNNGYLFVFVQPPLWLPLLSNLLWSCSCPVKFRVISTQESFNGWWHHFHLASFTPKNIVGLLFFSLFLSLPRTFLRHLLSELCQLLLLLLLRQWFDLNRLNMRLQQQKGLERETIRENHEPLL